MTRKLTLIILLNLFCVCVAMAQGTAFTYQGRLLDGAVPATANYDFEFRLFDAKIGGTQAGATVQKLNVAVASGIFTVTLDFGNQFPGADRVLDISVRTAGGDTFTPLTPRQLITSAPHSIRSLNSATADTTTKLALLGSLRWDLLKSQSTFSTGTGPYGVAFDGTNIWVTNLGSSNVTKRRVFDGLNLGTFSTGASPSGIAFDGANIWVVSSGGNAVTKLRTSDGAFIDAFLVGTSPNGVAFDGTNMWVANQGSNNMTRLSAGF